MTASPWPWDSAPATLTTSLASRLADQFGIDSVYLLIDPGQGDPPGIEIDGELGAVPPGGVQRARAAAWGREIHSLHSSEYRRSTALDFPYLVQLNGTSDPWLATSIEWAVQEHLKACAIGTGVYRIGGWLRPYSGRGGHAMARQLSLLMQYSGCDGSPMMARLHDRRVLHLLRRGIPLDGASCLKGIQRWSYLDHNLALQSLQGERGEPGSQQLPAMVAHSGLLNRSSAIHIAQTIWLRTTFPLPDNAQDMLLDKVRAAEQRGLVHAKDQGAYAAEALIEPAFEHWPRLDMLIEAIARFHQELSDGMDIYRTDWAGKSPDHWRNPEERPV